MNENIQVEVPGISFVTPSMMREYFEVRQNEKEKLNLLEEEKKKQSRKEALQLLKAAFWKLVKMHLEDGEIERSVNLGDFLYGGTSKENVCSDTIHLINSLTEQEKAEIVKGSGFLHVEFMIESESDWDSHHNNFECLHEDHFKSDSVEHIKLKYRLG